MFMGSRPIPQPNWGYGVAQTDFRRLQPLWEVVLGLLRGLTGVEILWTFFSHGVQPLRQREVIMWMHPRLSCPDCPFSTELGDMEINTQMRGVLAPRANPNLGSNLIP
jgi:hypothetical protein